MKKINIQWPSEFNNSVRRSAFWGLDYLRGAPVAKHFHNVREVTENASLLPEHQTRLLRSLLHHAIQTTDFYKNQVHPGKLETFPVVDKNIIKTSYDQFLSSAFKGKRLKVMETSGSTGTPFRLLQNDNKRKRVLADLIYFNSLVGYKVGCRYAYFRTIDSTNIKNPVLAFMQNTVQFDVRTQNCESLDLQRRRLLEDRNIEFIIGYSSAIFDIACHLIKNGDIPASLRVKGVLCLADPLTSKMREKIRKAFGCQVLTRYSNQEFGVLAYECPVCNRYHLNTASMVFETLELDRDVPTSPGAKGRIVVTDLYNYAMPMIRYDTGDMGAIIESDCGHYGNPILQSLEGRRVDRIYDTGGQPLVPFVVDSLFDTIDHSHVIKQYQFIQEDRTRYRVCLTVDETLCPREDIIRHFKQLMGTDALITVDYVDEIPLMNSGKRKYIVNNYKSDNALREC